MFDLQNSDQNFKVLLNSLTHLCLTDTFSTVSFCSANSLALQSAILYGYYKLMKKRHSLPDSSQTTTILLSMSQLMPFVCYQTPFSVFSQKLQSFMGSFSQPIWQFNTLLTHYELLILCKTSERILKYVIWLAVWN